MSEAVLAGARNRFVTAGITKSFLIKMETEEDSDESDDSEPQQFVLSPNLSPSHSLTQPPAVASTTKKEVEGGAMKKTATLEPSMKKTATFRTGRDSFIAEQEEQVPAGDETSFKVEGSSSQTMTGTMSTATTRAPSTPGTQAVQGTVPVAAKSSAMAYPLISPSSWENIVTPPSRARVARVPGQFLSQSSRQATLPLVAPSAPMFAVVARSPTSPDLVNRVFGEPLASPSPELVSRVFGGQAMNPEVPVSASRGYSDQSSEDLVKRVFGDSVMSSSGAVSNSLVNSVFGDPKA